MKTDQADGLLPTLVSEMDTATVTLPTLKCVHLSCEQLLLLNTKLVTSAMNAQQLCKLHLTTIDLSFSILIFILELVSVC
jgi:hypothetical protein